MKIEYLRAKNFMCFGEDAIELDFTGLGNIVCIHGKNLDYEEENNSEDDFYSNATGKSTIAEAISYGLYGSTIRRKVNHTNAINNTTKKKLEVEIIFEKHGRRYRIIRTRKPDTVRLWKDGPPWINAEDDEENNNEFTVGGQPATQKEIESVLGMSHKAFVNVMYFGQHNDYNLLECSSGEQREIAESLLALDVYKKYSATVKDEIKSTKQDLKVLVAEYERIKDSETSCKSRISNLEHKIEEWKLDHHSRIKNLKQKIEQLKKQLETSNEGAAFLAYEKAQEDIKNINESLPMLRENKVKITNAVEQANDSLLKISEKKHELSLECKSIERDVIDSRNVISTCKREIDNLHNLKPGSKCPVCFGPIDPKHSKHIINLNQNKAESANENIKSLMIKMSNRKSEIKDYDERIAKLKSLSIGANEKCSAINNKIHYYENRLSELNKIKIPDLTSDEILINEKVNHARHAIEELQAELEQGGPYTSILNGAKEDLEKITNDKKNKKGEIAEIEEILPYYEYWVKGFGDNGIRQFVIEGIVPVLNTRISYWLYYLVNNKLTVKFDKHLNVVIDSNPSDGKPYHYFATCGSERRRINLAISQAFAHVTMFSAGTWPSLVFLDEVTDSIDTKGVNSIYKMICELASEKQVFIITHNVKLKEMLSGTDSITMVRKNKVSKLDFNTP